jgi:hypothetical protein
MKKFVFILAVLLLIATPAFANERNLKTAEEYGQKIDALTFKDVGICLEVFDEVFPRAKFIYSYSVERWNIERQAEAVRNADWNTVVWSQRLFGSVLTPRLQGIRHHLEIINEQGWLTDNDLKALRLAREMVEIATTQPALDDLGAAILAFSQPPVGCGESECLYCNGARKAHALYLAFKEELKTPLPWPEGTSAIIPGGTIGSNRNQNNTPASPPNIPPSIPIASSLGGIAIYHALKRSKTGNKHITRLQNEIRGSFNVGDVLHTAIEDRIPVRVVKYGRNSLTVGSTLMRRTLKVHKVAPAVFAVIDAAVAAGLDVYRGEKLDQDRRQTARNAGKTAAKASISFGGGWVGGKAGAKLGAAIGTAIFPGPGTVIGGVIGSIVGGSTGSGTSSFLMDLLWP